MRAEEPGGRVVQWQAALGALVVVLFVADAASGAAGRGGVEGYAPSAGSPSAPAGVSAARSAPVDAAKAPAPAPRAVAGAPRMPQAPPTPAEVAGFTSKMQQPGKAAKLAAPWSSSYWRPGVCKDSRPVTPKSDPMYKVLESLARQKKRPPGWLGSEVKRGEAEVAKTVERVRAGDATRCKVVPFGEDAATPDLAPGAWGTCAFVAQGDVLLRRYSQEHIDSYDTVIRLGHMRLKNFERFTGERCDVIVGRFKSHRASEDDGSYTKLKYIIGQTNPLRTFPGAKRLELKCSKGTLAQDLYGFMTGTIGRPGGRQKHRGASSGVTWALKLYESRLCTSIHLYGLSMNCGGRYSSDGKEVMKVHHSCELESWILHNIMRTSEHPNQLCVYI